MNSLLQTLFMTPDLRQRLYLWSFVETDDSKKEDSIPFQLQLLFGRLQLSRQPAVDTRGLTKSFQWDYRDSFTQHDVQEFCRVLFDAIERSVKGTSQENIINELYQGVLIDYVKCQTCGAESHREDKFLDVSLAVKSDLDRVYNDSLEKALDTFVRLETLTGTNQYECEKCNRKRNAIKGLRFKSFPRIFVIQLKRFDLDYHTMTKKKINDYVSFPQILDLNRFILSPCKSEQPSERLEGAISSIPLPDDLEHRIMKLSRVKVREGMQGDAEKQSLELDLLATHFIAKNSALAQREERQRKIAACLENGEHVYELYSVMVHSGSALGGHYYAYIKCFENDRWYMFNDSSVREANEEELKQTFGGTEGKGWSAASASAYLLSYRKIAPDSLRQVEDSAVPDYIREAMEEEKKREAEESLQRAERLKQIVVRVYYNMKEKTFTISRERKLMQLLQLALSEFGLEQVSREDVRLRAYLQQSDSYLESYAGKEELTLEELRISSCKTLALEQKEPGDTFQEYDPQGMLVKVVVWDDAKSSSPTLTLAEKSALPKRIQINRKATLEDLLTRLQTVTEIPKTLQVLLRRTYMTSASQAEVLSVSANWKKTMADMRIVESSVLYLEQAVEGQTQHRWEKEFDLEQNRISIRFNSPDDPPSYSPFEQKYRVLIDSRATVSALKEAIAQQLKLPVDSFILRRGYNKIAAEIKNLDQKLSFANMITGTSVFVEKGIPTKADEFRINISYASEPKSTGSDGTLFSFYDLGQVIVPASKTIREVKEDVARQANCLYPTMDLDPAYFCLRERGQDRVGRVLKEADCLRDCQPADCRQVCVHSFPERMELKPRDVLVTLRVWRPSTWELGPVIHFVASKDWSLADFGDKLSGVVGILQSNLMATKIIRLQSFTRTELANEAWVRLVEKRERLEGYPLSLTTDGSLLVLKDRQELPRPLSESEKQQFAVPSDRQSRPSWPYEKVKEKSVVIKVKGEKAEEEKQH